MPLPIVLLTPEELAAHTNEHSYKWTKGAICGNWLVLIAPQPSTDYPVGSEYGYKERSGMDSGGLWFENGKLVDEDGNEDVGTWHNDYVTDAEDNVLEVNRSITLKPVGHMLEALGMDVQDYVRLGR